MMTDTTIRPSDLRGYEAISYARFSSDAQRGGSSIQRQEEAARTFCTAYGLTLKRTEADEALSAYHKKNVSMGGLGRILQALEDGQLNTEQTVLLVEQLDRLTRDKMWDAANLLRDITRRGLLVVTLKDQKVYSFESLNSNIGEAVMLIVELSQGHAYSDNLSRRMKAAYKLRLDEAEKNGKNFKVRKLPWWLDRNTFKETGKPAYTAKPSAAQTMRDIVGWHLIENLGTVAVVQRLIAEGREGPNGASWSVPGLDVMLRSPALYGTYDHLDIQLPGYFEPLIDEIDFLRLQALRKERHRKPKQSVSRVWLQGLLRCGQCGGPVWIRAGKAHHKYAICKSKHLKAGCIASNESLKTIEDAVLSRLGALSTVDAQDVDRKAMETLELERDNHRQKMDRATEMALDTANPVIRRRLLKDAETAQERVEALEAQLATMMQQAAVSADLADLEDIEGTIRELVDTGDYSEANRELKRVVGQIVVHPKEGIEIKNRDGGRITTVLFPGAEERMDHEHPERAG